MIFDPPARRRTAFRVVLPIVVILAAVLAVVVSASGDETQAELEYMEELQAQATEVAKSGDSLREVVSRLQRIDRTEFVTVIDGIREDLALSREFIDADPPLDTLLSVRAMFRQALAAWESGVGGFEAAVLNAADTPEEDLTPVDTMANALAELRAGDNLYADLVVDMRRDDVPNPLTDMPRVTLMPADGSLVALSIAYIDSARSPNSELGLRPGLKVSQLLSNPEWQTDASDQVVLPATESVVFSAVITNVGNVRSDAETVLLTFTGGPEQVRLTQEIAPLDPNQQVTLIFEPLAVEAEGIYEVLVELVVTGEDSDLTDNEIVVQFTVSS